MPGRGNNENYAELAAKVAKEIVDKYFSDYSDECKAAVMQGVLAIHAANVVPSYVLETENY